MLPVRILWDQTFALAKLDSLEMETSALVIINETVIFILCFVRFLEMTSVCLSDKQPLLSRVRLR